MDKTRCAHCLEYCLPLRQSIRTFIAISMDQSNIEELGQSSLSPTTQSPPRVWTSAHVYSPAGPQEVPYELSVIQPANAVTRVMSPNQQLAYPQQQLSQQTNIGILNLDSSCDICNQKAAEHIICAECGKHGHVYCLKINYLQGYPFCEQCFEMIYDYWHSTFENDPEGQIVWQQETQMTLNQSIDRINRWKMRAARVMEVSANVGFVTGAAASLMTGAAITATHALVQGAMSALSADPP